MNIEDKEKRIVAIHEWYCANVMRVPLSEYTKRLWWDWLKAGHNGHELAKVIRYLRKQIMIGKRQNGSLALTNLLGLDTNGVPRFDTDLGLASANYHVDAKLSALPPGEAPAKPAPTPGREKAMPTAAQQKPVPTAAQIQARVEELSRLKRTLTTDAIENG